MCHLKALGKCMQGLAWSWRFAEGFERCRARDWAGIQWHPQDDKGGAGLAGGQADQLCHIVSAKLWWSFLQCVGGGVWTVSYNVPGNFQVLKCPVPPVWSLSQLKPFSSPWLVLSQTRKHSGRGWERYLQLFILFFFVSSSLSLYSFDLAGTEQGERSGSGKVEMLFRGQQRCDLQMFSGS